MLVYQIYVEMLQISVYQMEYKNIILYGHTISMDDETVPLYVRQDTTGIIPLV